MVTEKIVGENFDEYLQGAIDALLSKTKKYLFI